MNDLFSLLPEPALPRRRSSSADPLLDPAAAPGATAGTAPSASSEPSATSEPSAATAASGSPLVRSTSPAPLNGVAQPDPSLPVAASSGGGLEATNSPAGTVSSLSAPASSAVPVAADPAFDGLLISWDPRTPASERANARAALGLTLREEIHTRAMRAAGAGPIERVVLSSGRSAEEVLQQLSRRAGVSFAEKNWLYQTQATSNDPGVVNGSTWGLYGESSSPVNAFGSQAAEAWSRGFTGSDTVFVGVIDEGYQYTHSDLVANAGRNPGEISGNGIDDDQNGYIDDDYGWDFDANNNSIYDGTVDDHGTHVAGTIGGQGGNGIGVAGVSWDVSLLSAKFLGANGGSTANAIKAVDYFTDLKTRQGINLVATNNSWGGGGYSQGLYDAISRANTAGIFFVAAAGNSSTSSLSYPAAYDLPNVISVASLDSNGALSSFSNFSSTWVDMGAPGGGVYSTLPDNSYGSYSGTSMAAPHVTGTLALMRAGFPAATMGQLRQALFESVVPTSSLSGRTATGGRLDANGALLRLSQLVDPNAPTYAVSAPASVNEGAGLTFSLSTTNVAADTALYWRITGNVISTADFVGLASLQGTLVVDDSGGAVLPLSIAADLLSEGNETLLFDVFSDSGFTTRVTGTSVVLNDTSKPSGVTLWGTRNRDTISGSGGPDRLAGVPSTGTTAADLGAGQVDTLTGLADSDVFLLGDSRGVFYDDRNGRSLGTTDYALIRDFVSGIDKLQVRAGTSYLYTVSGTTLSLYWDRNNNGLLNSSGNNMDEMIAMLQGVTSLTNADLIGV